jgi:outer membrane protein assembly factor BamB
LLATAIPGAAVTAAAQQDTAWRYVSPEPIRRATFDPAGHLLLITTRGLRALGADGSLLYEFWLSGEEFRMLTVPNHRMIVWSGSALATIDATTGEAIWARQDLPPPTAAWLDRARDSTSALLRTAGGLALLDLVTGQTLWDSTAFPPSLTLRGYQRISDDVVLLFGRAAADESVLLGVSHQTGQVLWNGKDLIRKSVKFRKYEGIEYPATADVVPLPDSTTILHLTTEGPLRIEPRTGTVLWRSEALAGDPVPEGDHAAPAAVLFDSQLVVARKRELVALDIGTGQLRWTSGFKYDDRPDWVVAAADRLVVGRFGKSPGYLHLLDLEGRPRRPFPLGLGSRANAFIIDDTVYIADSDQLFALPLDTGDLRELGTLDFGGGREAISYALDSIQGNGLLVLSFQNAVRIDRDGTVRYRRHYKAPGPGYWDRFGANLKGQRLPANYAKGVRRGSNLYLMTNRADSLGTKGVSLVRLNLIDGREVGRMQFDEPNPSFVVDPDRPNFVYQIEWPNTIIARQFGKPEPAPGLDRDRFPVGGRD